MVARSVAIKTNTVKHSVNIPYNSTQTYVRNLFYRGWVKIQIRKPDPPRTTTTMGNSRIFRLVKVTGPK